MATVVTAHGPPPPEHADPDDIFFDLPSSPSARAPSVAVAAAAVAAELPRAPVIAGLNAPRARGSGGGGGGGGGRGSTSPEKTAPVRVPSTGKPPPGPQEAQQAALPGLKKHPRSLELPEIVSAALVRSVAETPLAPSPRLSDASASSGDRQTRPRGRGRRRSRSANGVRFVKVTAHNKKHKDFGSLYRWQDIDAHDGPIWTVQFSRDGAYLATAGQDMVVLVWVVRPGNVLGATRALRDSDSSSSGRKYRSSGSDNGEASDAGVEGFVEDKPLRRFCGHRADILGMSWSKNSFLLTSSMDKTVRLWHPQSEVCLHVFPHSDSVTTVTFHPFDETKFISGSIDGLVRLWAISPEAEELAVAHVEDIVTTSTINRDGKTAIVGTYGGRCKFYSITDECGQWCLKHTTQMEVRSRRGKNVKARKITGFSYVPYGDEFLVSSNDSRHRLYRSTDKALVCKYYGHQSVRSSLFGSFSADGRYLLSGSEDGSVYLWDVQTGIENSKEKKASYEAFQPFDNASISMATFGPSNHISASETTSDLRTGANGLIVVAASNKGGISIFQNL